MLALADWFVQSGGINGERGRMAAHLARGAALPEIFTEVSAPSVAAYSPKPGPVAQGVLVGFEFGQVPAELLEALSAPWRAARDAMAHAVDRRRAAPCPTCPA